MLHLSHFGDEELKGYGSRLLHLIIRLSTIKTLRRYNLRSGLAESHLSLPCNGKFSDQGCSCACFKSQEVNS